MVDAMARPLARFREQGGLLVLGEAQDVEEIQQAPGVETSGCLVRTHRR